LQNGAKDRFLTADQKVVGSNPGGRNSQFFGLQELDDQAYARFKSGWV